MNWGLWALLALLVLVLGRQFLAQRGVVNIPADEVKRRLEAREKLVVVDVREEHEYRAGHIPGAILVPLSRLEHESKKLKKDAELVLVCRSGNRSVTAYHKLKALGFANLKNMPGGMNRWTGKTQ